MGRENDGERSFMPHANFLIRTDPGFKPKLIGKELSDATTFHSTMGAPTVNFTKRRKTAQDLARVASYLVKRPFSGKLMVPTRLGFGYERTMSGMGPDNCMRLAEVLSHLKLNELMFSTGAYTSVRQEILHDVRNSKALRKSTSSLPTLSPAKFWR